MPIKYREDHPKKKTTTRKVVRNSTVKPKISKDKFEALYVNMARHYLRWVRTGKRITAREDWDNFAEAMEVFYGFKPPTIPPKGSGAK